MFREPCPHTVGIDILPRAGVVAPARISADVFAITEGVPLVIGIVAPVSDAAELSETYASKVVPQATTG
jgi:hypothetical protein